jgi:hypothetical protein
LRRNRAKKVRYAPRSSNVPMSEDEPTVAGGGPTPGIDPILPLVSDRFAELRTGDRLNRYYIRTAEYGELRLIERHDITPT